MRAVVFVFLALVKITARSPVVLQHVTERTLAVIGIALVDAIVRAVKLFAGRGGHTSS